MRTMAEKDWLCSTCFRNLPEAQCPPEVTNQSKNLVNQPPKSFSHGSKTIETKKPDKPIIEGAFNAVAQVCALNCALNCAFWNPSIPKLDVRNLL